MNDITTDHLVDTNYYIPDAENPKHMIGMVRKLGRTRFLAIPFKEPITFAEIETKVPKVALQAVQRESRHAASYFVKERWKQRKGEAKASATIVEFKRLKAKKPTSKEQVEV